MSGEELNNIDDDVLVSEIERICVFARIVPEQKLRIIRALRANGEVVAMTGDGVNDAPVYMLRFTMPTVLWKFPYYNSRFPMQHSKFVTKHTEQRSLIAADKRKR